MNLFYYDALSHICSDKYLELNISFFMNGILFELIKYFRNESHYTLDELLLNIKNWFQKGFRDVP